MNYMTDERRQMQEGARRFTMNEVLPLANKLDPERGDIPMELREKLADMGYFGINIPEEYGGLGLGAFEYCLVTEELARGWMSVASIIRNSTAGTLFPVEMMSQYQRDKYLHRMATGQCLLAFAMSEPSTGSDVSGISCRAVRDGDSWLLSGNKYWCTFADAADGIVVIARSDKNVDPKRRFKGLSAFLVDKKRGEFPNGMQGHAIPKIGYHGWKTFELSLDNVRVPAENLIGEEGEAFYMIGKGMEKARAQTAARAIGLARGALEDSINFAGERRQFDRAIAEFQAIRFKIGDMAAQIEACRQLMYHVCTQIDEGKRCDKEAAMVKYLATEMAERVTSEGIQIHGGGGYTTMFAVERYWRDARVTKIFEGTSEIQLRIISDHLLGKARS